MEGALATDAADLGVRSLLDARAELVVAEPGAGLLAVFATPQEATAAALAIRVEGLLGAARVGVAAGPGDLAADAALRPAAQQARSLLRLARSGSVLVVASLVDASEAEWAVGQRWFLTLDQREGPVSVVALVDERFSDAPINLPLPASVRSAATTPFVHRNAELERLAAAWSAASAGSRATLIMRGDAGAGKTRLAAAFAHEVHRQGGLVLASRFDAGAAPYAPFAEALRYFADRQAPERLNSLLGPSSRELSRLLPEREADLGGPRVAPGDPDLERHRLFVAVDEWLAAAAANTGLLLVLDDAHLAAPDAVSLVSHLARSSAAARLLLVVLLREGEGSEAWTELASSSDVRVEETRVGPLDSTAVVDVATAHVPASARLLRRLGKELETATGGNALYVVQLAHHIAESQVAASAPSGSGLLDLVGVPSGLAVVLGRRLEMLGERAVEVLSRAAIVGEVVDVSLLAAVVDIDRESLDEVVAEAVARGMLRPADAATIVFSHGLVRAALVDRVSPTRRARLHVRVADAILDAPGGVGATEADAVRHLLAAGGRDARLHDLARRAGAEAVQRLSFAEAETMFTAAVEALPSDASEAVRDDLAFRLATARHLAGKAGAADEIVAMGLAAAERADEARTVEAALACGRGFFARLAGIDRGQVSLLQRALDLHPTADADRARLLARLATELSFGPQVAGRRMIEREALSLARSLSDSPDVMVDALASLNAAHLLATLDERLELTGELVELADATGDVVLSTRARWPRTSVLLEAGRLDEFASVAEEGIRFADEARQPILQWASRLMRAGHLASRARLAEAEQAALAALDLGTSIGEVDAVLFYGGVLFQIRYEQDRLGEVAALYRPFADTEGAPAMVSVMQAVIECDQGDVDEPRRRLSALAVDDFALVPEDLLRLPTLVAAAEVAARVGDVDAATVLDAALEPATDRLAVTMAGAIGLSGSVAHYRGLLRELLEDHDAAVALFEAGLRRHEEVGAPAWLNRSRVALASTLVRTEPVRAANLAQDAIRDCDKLGLVALRRQARSLL